MNKRSALRLVSCMMVGAMFSLGAWKLTALVERKDTIAKYMDFYAQRENFDVLFFGTSHVRNGIYPMELWKDYGIISYNFSGSNNPLATSYWMLVNALDYTQPKVAVIDCSHLAWDGKASANTHFTHFSFDAVPLSMNKLRAVFDIFPEVDKRMEFILKLRIYHDRWKGLSQEDFIVIPHPEKGAWAKLGVAVPKKVNHIPLEDKMTKNTISTRYLEKIIELCTNKNITVLLTFLPFPATDGFIRESHRVFDIAKKYKLNYLSWETLKDKIDFDIDFYDSDHHMNFSGGRKISKYIGKYLKDQYHIQDQRHNPKYKHWHDDYINYRIARMELIKKASTSVKNILMLLSDRNYSYAVYFPNGRLYQDKIVTKLLCNTGIDEEQVISQSPDLIVVDNKNCNISYCKVNETADSSFGKITVKSAKEGYVFNVENKNYLEINKGEHLAAAVIVFDNDSDECVVAQKCLAL